MSSISLCWESASFGTMLCNCLLGRKLARQRKLEGHVLALGDFAAAMTAGLPALAGQPHPCKADDTPMQRVPCSNQDEVLVDCRSLRMQSATRTGLFD